MSKLYQRIASAIIARANCEESGNFEWFAKHTETLESIARDHLPRGSGFDSGSTIDVDRSTAERIVINTAYHHMDDGGCYDGWTEHDVIVTPSLAFGFNLRITGRDRNEFKDYASELFHSVLSEDEE